MENHGSNLGDQRRLHLNGSQRIGRVLTSRERDGVGPEDLKRGNSENKGKQLGKRQQVSHSLIHQILRECLECQRAGLS